MYLVSTTISVIEGSSESAKAKIYKAATISQKGVNLLARLLWSQVSPAHMTNLREEKVGKNELGPGRRTWRRDASPAYRPPDLRAQS